MSEGAFDPRRIGEAFQEATKYHPDRPSDLAGFPLVPERRSFPETQHIPLPRPEIEGGPGLWETTLRRRSVRRYARVPVQLGQLSQMLWASQGVTALAGGHRLRAAPSAGALYPCETYLVVNGVEELDPGLYHYEVYEHELAFLREGELGPELGRAACGQSFCAKAAAVFVWTAVIPRCGAKYRQRAFRYIHLDAGHLGQCVALAAVGLGLGTCQIAAFYDDEVNKILGVDGQDETTLYLTTVGRPTK